MQPDQVYGAKANSDLYDSEHTPNEKQVTELQLVKAVSGNSRNGKNHVDDASRPSSKIQGKSFGSVHSESDHSPMGSKFIKIQAKESQARMSLLQLRKKQIEEARNKGMPSQKGNTDIKRLIRVAASRD